MKVGGVTETNKEKRGTQESYHLQAWGGKGREWHGWCKPKMAVGEEIPPEAVIKIRESQGILHLGGEGMGRRVWE